MIRVAVAQPMVVPGDVDENIRRMAPMVEQAAKQHAHLALFSEAGITGYDLKGVGISAALAADDPRLDRIAEMARRYEVVIANGLHERAGDTLYNSAIAFFPDGRRILQRKHWIIEHEKDNTQTAAADRRREVFEVNGVKLAMLICSDGGMPGVFEELAEQGVDATLHLAAGCGNADWAFRENDMTDPEKREAMLELGGKLAWPRGAAERALTLGLGSAAVNQLGRDDATGYYHPGHSSVVDTNGDVTALLCGKPIIEHAAPSLAVGVIHARG